MKLLRTGLLSLGAAMLALLWLASPLAAQTVTTGTLTGVVMDMQGGVLPGASVTAVHVPTGTTYETTTEADGRFTILNVGVGGPYLVTVTMPSFRDQQHGDIQVSLGEARSLSFKLDLATVTETVTVVGEASLIDPARAGTASNVGAQTIEALPTVTRSLADFARLSPHFNASSQNEGQTFITVAGRNNRYNSVQIDGAVNNDLFGLADSGTPGGQTETQPISLDAIQELQLVVSPYDVRQGMFTGGAVNAITRSGSNALRGTAYYFGRNDDFVGKGPDNRKVSTFSDRQSGGSIGGRIVENKAFYFGNVDITRKNTPSGFSVSGSGQRFGHEAEVARFLSILKNRYGYDPGSTDEFTRTTNSNKVFVRSDLNLSNQHRLTVRHNFIDATNDIGFPGSTFYIFPDSFYQIRDKTNSSVVQLNSTFGRAYNEFRLAYTRVRDNRDGPTRFPLVRVRTADGSTLRAGRENFSTANRLDQDVVELTDEFTMVRGKHTLVVGTHNEFFKFDNLFIRDNFGNYEFSNLDLFEAGLAQSFDYSFSATANPQQSAKFKVNQVGFYAGDQWRLADRLTVTYGVRVDKPNFPDKPTRNPASEATFGYRTDVAPNPTLWSPRVGFNWDLRGNGKEQVRGGLGLFAGRTPYVWLSNQYGNTGIEFTRLSVRLSSANRIPFVASPDAQPKTVGAAATNEIDLVDPDYKYPQLIRGNIAYDRELGFWGLIGTAEVLFSTDVKEIKYQNLNLVQSAARPDARPVYTRRVATLSDVIFLTNTDEGSQWSLSFKVERPYRKGFYMSGSYLYGESTSIMDGTSSQAASNWGNVYVPGDPNNPPLTRSAFDVAHRVNLAGSYQFQLGRGTTATVSLYYNGQSGRPYAMTYINDYNGDGRTGNDLVYVPSSANDVVIRNGTYENLLAFINGDEAMKSFLGAIMDRNAGRGPWNNSLDFRVAVGLPMRRTKVELTVDVLNFINLFDRASGLVTYPRFNQISPIRFLGMDAATGRPIYDIAPLMSPTFRKFQRDDLRSRWQAQFGVRFRF